MYILSGLVTLARDIDSLSVQVTDFLNDRAKKYGFLEHSRFLSLHRRTAVNQYRFST